MNGRVFAGAVLALFSAVNTVEAGASEDIRVAMTKLLCQMFDIFVAIAGSIAVLVIVMAGAEWIKNADEPKKRGQAKEKVIHAFIGLLLIVIAYELVLTAVGGVGTICGSNEIWIP